VKKPRLHITDHAIVRYLQRAEGMDMDARRAKIGQIVEGAEDHPGSSGVRAGGLTYRIEGDAVVTVTHSNRPDLKIGNRRRRRRGDRSE